VRQPTPAKDSRRCTCVQHVAWVVGVHYGSQQPSACKRNTVSPAPLTHPFLLTSLLTSMVLNRALDGPLLRFLFLPPPAALDA